MLFAFLTGGALYALIELAWRARTHISMFFAGGACMCVLRALSMSGLPLALQCVLGAAAATLAELILGLVLNLRLGLGIWDYSARRFNFRGQICALYSALWLPLCLAGLLLCRLFAQVLPAYF